MTALPNSAAAGSSPMFLAEYAPITAGDAVDPAVLPEGILAAHTITNGNGSRAVLTQTS